MPIPKLFPVLLFSLGVFLLSALHAAEAKVQVERWGVYELSLPGPSTGNPFTEVRFAAVFDNGRKKIEVPGFYDGDGVYRVRFMPDTEGSWRYRTESNRWELTGKTGALEVGKPAAGNHGPVRVHNTYHFAYEDGTPYRQIGTTIYNWTDAPAEVQEETLRTLADSPFNKIRMLLTPQKSSYRKSFAPPLWPYEGKAPQDWDFTRFNPAYFRHLEKRIAQLGAQGVEADLILFNPYGRWGFETMSAANDDLFVRYVVARFAAYRNVWWSLANEYDFLETKTEADWDRLGALVRQCDPFNHLRSIHNGLRIYDHRASWVTHASIQSATAAEHSGSAEFLRCVWQKPVVFDEIQYEGDAKYRWAALSGFDLVHRFWSGLVAGTYVGHGDYFNTQDEDTWTSFGGHLGGNSVPRLAFLRKIMEEGPGDGFDQLDRDHDPNTAGVAGEYYLSYLGREKATSWPFRLCKTMLSEGMRFSVEIIDVWEMSITPVEGVFVVKQKDRYTFVDKDGRSVPLPGKAGIALRIRRIADQPPAKP